ncbi:gamma-glutamylcyclotransferase family protein [Sphingomonas sp. CJ99]
MDHARATEQVFSYGTLQQEGVQRATYGRLLTGRADSLTGWRMGTVIIRDPDVLDASGIEKHLALEPDADAPAVTGMVFDLTPEELTATDIYESENYARVRVTLESGTEAWVYVKQAG